MAFRRGAPALTVLLVGLTLACASADATLPQTPGGQTEKTPVAPWERLIRSGVFEHRGAARIEPLGKQWMLTVYCDGVNSTYLDRPTDEQIKSGASLIVAQYEYVDIDVPDPRCVRAPCGPVRERRIRILSLRALPDVPGRADQLKQKCAAQG